MKITGKLRGISLKDGKEISTLQRKKFEALLQKKKESLQIKALIYAQKKNQCRVLRQKHTSVKYINGIFIRQKINNVLL